jgi:hypothetical protein
LLEEKNQSLDDSIDKLNEKKDSLKRKNDSLVISAMSAEGEHFKEIKAVEQEREEMKKENKSLLSKIT